MNPYNGTVTFVIIDDAGNIRSRFRVSSVADARRYFPMKGGRPVIGPNVFRELTHRELAALGKPANYKRTNYADCLVPAEVPQ